MPDEPASNQKLLPRVGMIWFFVAVTAFAALIMIVRAADQGGALLRGSLAMLVWSVVLAGLYALFFLFAYTVGWLEKLVAPVEVQPKSPFAKDALPEQQVQPMRVDAQ